MGALMRREQVDNVEVHISTGKLKPAGQQHEPQWSEWFSDGPAMMRQCRHPDCDLDDYKSR